MPDGVTLRGFDEDDLGTIVDLVAGRPSGYRSLSGGDDQWFVCRCGGWCKGHDADHFDVHWDSGSVSTHPVVLLRVGKGAQAVIAEWHNTRLACRHH